MTATPDPVSEADASFDEKVWALCARVPAGRVTTYGAIARALGTRAYRAVGQALNRNPHAPRVPCHRVVARDGRLGGFARGAEAKRARLEAEGVPVTNGRVPADRIVQPADPAESGS